jgi:hypothetical protein
MARNESSILQARPHSFCFPGSTALICYLFFLIINPSSVMSQAHCSFGVQRISALKGVVFSKTEGVPGVKVMLVDRKDRKTIVAETITDGSGNFSISNVKDGKYLAVIQCEFFAVVKFYVRIDRGNKKRSGKLLVHLAPDFKTPCSEGGVEFVASD